MNTIASLFETPVIDPTRFWFFDIKLSATSIALDSSRDPKATSKMPLKYFAYGFGKIHPNKFTKQSEFLSKIKNWGFTINPLSRELNTLEEISNYHKN